ncbi:MAG: hypothetical protein U0Q16_16925 [Bryobacteraceae bacterium]
MRCRHLFLLLSLAAAVAQEPPGRAQFIEASIAYHEGNFSACITGYQKTIALHHEVPFSKMMIARCLGLMGKTDEALDALDEAAEFEYGNAGVVRNDPEFASLRQSPRFAEIITKMQTNLAPCAPRARRHQFDFWLGEWDVTDANGKPSGSEQIERAEGGCLIKETFTGPNGGTGQSVSFYEKYTGYWRQVWMDPSGVAQDFYGEFTADGMVLRQVSYNGGQKTILEIVYAAQAGGTVNQSSRRSIDDGATWTTTSTFVFTPKAR